MARTADELLEDQQQEEEEQEEAEESEGEDDAVPYNPKNLPLGWDGKVRKDGVFPRQITERCLMSIHVHLPLSLFISSSLAHPLLAVQATRSQYHLLL